MAWCEAEMRELDPAPRVRRTGSKGLVTGLRGELSVRNLQRAVSFPHEITRGAQPVVIYSAGRDHGNFWSAAYRRICSRPEWAKRLQKVHTAKRQGSGGWRELDSAMSSDALLMNVFCSPRVLAEGRLPALLGVEVGQEPEFGFKPRVPLRRGLVDTTEVDMRLGSLMVEAKLTEGDFQYAAARKLDRYQDFDLVFERESLARDGQVFRGYQLIRGVLAAHFLGNSFCVVCDARRPDLQECWFGVMQAVRSFELRGRLRLVTWQEIAGTVPVPLRRFLSEKYGIEAQ